MGLFDFIVKRPKTTLAIWILITLVLAPFALQAMNKVIYNETKLLPESAEYVKAQNYLKEVMPNSTEYGIGEVLVIEGYKYPSKSAENWYFNFKREAINKGYVNSTFSIYDLMNETRANISENINRMYMELYNGTKMAEKGVYALNATLANISAQIQALYYNVSALYEASEGLIPIYSNLTKSLQEAYSQALRLQSLLDKLSETYKIVLLQANSTYDKLYEGVLELHSGLLGLDQNYTKLYNELLLLKSQIEELKEGILGVNQLSYGVDEAFAYSYFNVLRAHYYLLKATSAYKNGLTPQDVQKVVEITNLTKYGISSVPSGIVEATYQEVMELTHGNASLASDTLLMQIAYDIAEKSIEEKVNQSERPIAISMLQNFTKDFYSAYSAWAEKNGTLLGKLVYLPSNPTLTIQSQVEVFGDLKEISYYSMILYSKDPEVIRIVQGMIPEENSSESVASFILRAAVNIGTPPNESVMKELIIEFLSEEMPAGSPINSTVLDEIYSEIPTPRNAIEILKAVLKENEKALGLLPLVEEYDPNATGRLITNESAMIDAITEVLEKEGVSGVPLKTFVGYVISGKAKEAQDLIIEVFKSGFIQNSREMLVGFGVPKEVADQLINYTLEYYSEMNNTLAYHLATEIIASSPMVSEKKAFIKALEEMKEGTSAEKAALTLISESPKMKNAGPFAPLLIGVLEKVGPNGTSEEVWNASLDEILGMIPSGIDVKPLIPALQELHQKGKVTSEDFRHQAYKVISKQLSGMELKILNYTYEYGPNLTKKRVEEILLKVVSLPSFAAKAIKALGINPEDIIKDVVSNVLGGNIPVVQKYSEEAFEHIWPGIEENMTGILIGTNKQAFLVVLNVSSVNKELSAYNLAKETLPSGHKAYIIGPNLMEYEMKHYGQKDSQHVSLLSTVLVLIISIAVMGSVVAVILPFIGAGTASVMGLGTAYFLAVLGIVSLSQETNMLMLTAPLGLGVDYSVYMVYRYKLELSKGTDPKKAVIIAAKESLPGISASAFSDIIGFASLALAWDFPFMTSMGLTLPFSIVYVYIASLIVVPAFLSMALDKKKAWWPSKPTVRRYGVNSKAVKKLAKYAPLVFAGTILIGGIWGYSTFVMPTTHDWTIFLPMLGHSYQGYRAFEKDFAVGEIMPTFVVMHFPENWTKYRGIVEEIQDKIKNVSGVKKIYSPINDPRLVSKDGKTIAIEIYTSMNPLTSQGLKVVGEIETIAHSYRKDGIQVYVGGTAEASRDLQMMLNKDFYHKILPIVLVLMFLVLITTFQSLPVSLLIMADIFLGVFAGLAVTDWIFRGIYGIELPWFLPLAIVAVMMGVGIDYNSFYINRVRELRREMDTREAVIRAAGEFSPVIIGLSLIVSGAFASLLIGGSWGVKEMGSSLTISVMVASIFATYLFLPVAIYLLGDKAWWPRKKF